MEEGGDGGGLPPPNAALVAFEAQCDTWPDFYQQQMVCTAISIPSNEILLPLGCQFGQL